jgi:hypothetical protein
MLLELILLVLEPPVEQRTSQQFLYFCSCISARTKVDDNRNLPREFQEVVIEAK